MGFLLLSETVHVATPGGLLPVAVFHVLVIKSTPQVVEPKLQVLATMALTVEPPQLTSRICPQRPCVQTRLPRAVSCPRARASLTVYVAKGSAQPPESVESAQRVPLTPPTDDDGDGEEGDGGEGDEEKNSQRVAKQ